MSGGIGGAGGLGNERRGYIGGRTEDYRFFHFVEKANQATLRLAWPYLQH